jgi:TnpA family transposase
MTDIKILSPARRRAFDAVPTLSKNERIGFLTQDKQTREIVSSLKTDENKVGFLLQRAYFQAKGRFFETKYFRPKDKRTAEKSLGISTPCDLSQYSSRTALRHKKLILQNYKWKPFSKLDRDDLEAHALLQVDKQNSNEDILFSLLDFCWKNKTEIPGYNELSKIVNASFLHYKISILERVENYITDEQKQTLLNLIRDPEVVLKFSDFKRVDQSITQKQLNRNAKILQLFGETFLAVKPLLDELHLTPEAIKHFSGWIYTSNISQIKQLKDVNDICLHIAAFVQDQFFLRQDYAVDAFLKIMRGTVNKARGYDRTEKDKIEQELMVANQSVLHSAKSSHQILKLIIEISNNSGFSLSERNQKVIHLAESFFEAENPEFVSHIQRMESSLVNNRLKVNFHQYLFAQSSSLQKSLSPFIKILEFDELNSSSSLITAIKYFSDKDICIDDETPRCFMSKNDENIVFSDNEIPVISRYKIMLFAYIEGAIRNRSLTLQHSYRYRANRSYMISDEQWDNKKSELISAARLDDYKNGKQVLQKMGKALTDTYCRVNKSYIDGKNEFLKVDKQGNWKLKMYEADFDASKYIPSLLSNSKYKLLYEVLSEIDSYTNFSDKFKHSSNKNANKTVDRKKIYAVLMSLGTNLGHIDMAKATKSISNKNLRDTEKLWFSNEGVSKANKCIVDFIQDLPLPTIFNDRDGVIHTSSDGKKVIVAVNSLLANYSYKYYGKEQGISVNSFVDEKQSFFHVNVLTSSDREAPYMMDGIVKTKSSLFREGDTDFIHSTDTHGYTEAIFAGLHFLDVSFAPRIAKVNEQTIYAYEAKSMKRSAKNVIVPKTAINKKRILDNWDDILRLMATIKLGYCSASLLFRILSSSTKANDLYSAIKEFGKLIKSQFILNYMDDESMRRSITKQLNRVELGQKLSEAVFFARKGHLHVGTPDEMQRVMTSKTLLKNAIILWNYLFLSDYYHGLENEKERKFVLESISNGSVISWRHINMHGLYDFDQEFISSFKATMKQMKSIKVDSWDTDEQTD